MQKEVKRRKIDILKNFTYESCVGVTGGNLVRKVNDVVPNMCVCTNMPVMMYSPGIRQQEANIVSIMDWTKFNRKKHSVNLLKQMTTYQQNEI